MGSKPPKTPFHEPEANRIALIEGVSCVILAGGESRRMGTNKAHTELAGEAMLKRVLARVRHIFPEVIISTHDEPFSFPGIPVIKDAITGRGPAVGLCTTLARARNPWVFLIGCDQPLVRPELIRYLAGLRDGYDTVVPEVSGRVQTLCALYKKSCLAPLTERITKGERGLAAFLRKTEGLRVRYVGEMELREADPGLKSFMDVDTREDLDEAEKILNSEE
jgi:molybdopterin-guanine dinucleotide biosynthesis protein A